MSVPDFNAEKIFTLKYNKTAKPPHRRTKMKPIPSKAILALNQMTKTDLIRQNARRRPENLKKMISGLLKFWALFSAFFKVRKVEDFNSQSVRFTGITEKFPELDQVFAFELNSRKISNPDLRSHSGKIQQSPVSHHHNSFKHMPYNHKFRHPTNLQVRFSSTPVLHPIRRAVSTKCNAIVSKGRLFLPRQSASFERSTPWQRFDMLNRAIVIGCQTF
ncbi:MAG TPA: hypothetical protein VG347_06220 [Verrucomicrobiae bacterium]|nr:hypothetical protein [Verrucomicrobiae bacterium]